LATPSPPLESFALQVLESSARSLAREHVAVPGDDRALACRLPAMIQAKDRAGVNPVPGCRLSALAAEFGALTQAVAFSQAPGVRCNHVLGFENLARLAGIGWGV
jgi:hypothetical protein